MLRCFLLVTVLVAAVHAAPAKDRIHSLPGITGGLKSKHYSGYVDVNKEGTWHMHYWFVESERNPEKDPVLIWVQGGPGASGLYGFFVELGPFRLNDLSFYNSSKTLHPARNPYTWAKTANLIFIESPLGIGFSYCDHNKCPLWSDNSTAEINYRFVDGWYKQFPEYKKNDLYIVGESYGGIYVPMLVNEIRKHPEAKIPLVGFGIGDGCVGGKAFGACGIDWMQWSMNFLGGHFALSRPLYVQIQKHCERSLHYGNWSKKPLCKDLVTRAVKMAGGYDIYYWYNQCWGEHDLVDIGDGNPPRKFLRSDAQGTPLSPEEAIIESLVQETNVHRRLQKLRTLLAPHTTAYIDGFHCGGQAALDTYLNQPDLQDAIHVPRMHWKQYDNWPHYNYTVQNVLPFYPHFLGKYRILVYNADEDPGVQERSAEEWVRNLGLKVTKEWRPWTWQGKQEVYGYVAQFEKQVDFLTVKGSGHMVPLFRPRHALGMISHWVDKTNWPHYVAAPQAPFSLEATVPVEKEDPATASIHSLTESQLIALQAEVLRLREQAGKC